MRLPKHTPQRHGRTRRACNHALRWLGLIEPAAPDPGPSYFDLAAYYDRASVEFDGVPLVHPAMCSHIANLERLANSEDGTA